MASSVKMLGVGMAVMLLVLKPEIGLAIVNGVSVGVQGIAESFQKESDKEPEENILYFIEKNSPKLRGWQREIVRIVRKTAQYFYPQGQSKVINEGCATFTHYEIINKMYDEGYLSDGFMQEFYSWCVY